MAFQIRKAQRSQIKLRIGLAGPSGSGKTYSALLLARGLTTSWEKVGIIDTENGSADLYSDLGPYNVITLEKPFSPQRYIEALEALEVAGIEVIVVDSITHEWSGAGGILELQEKAGGRFQDWAKVTPLHNKFIQALLTSKADIITTVRSKTDYAMTQDGKNAKVTKVGMKPETREGFEYEMTVSFDINVNHLAETSKDRTGLFKDQAPFVISEETGHILRDWSNGGVDQVQIIIDLAKQKGKAINDIENAYKVASLTDLSHGQKKAVIARLESLPDAKDEPTETPKEPTNEPAPKTEQPKNDVQEEQTEGDKIADEVEAGLEAQKKAESQQSVTVEQAKEALA